MRSSNASGPRRGPGDERRRALLAVLPPDGGSAVLRAGDGADLPARLAAERGRPGQKGPPAVRSPLSVPGGDRRGDRRGSAGRGGRRGVLDRERPSRTGLAGRVPRDPEAAREAGGG